MGDAGLRTADRKAGICCAKKKAPTEGRFPNSRTAIPRGLLPDTIKVWKASAGNWQNYQFVMLGDSDISVKKKKAERWGSSGPKVDWRSKAVREGPNVARQMKNECAVADVNP
jgi:hypothetical protein